MLLYEFNIHVMMSGQYHYYMTDIHNYIIHVSAICMYQCCLDVGEVLNTHLYPHPPPPLPFLSGFRLRTWSHFQDMFNFNFRLCDARHINLD